MGGTFYPLRTGVQYTFTGRGSSNNVGTSRSFNNDVGRDWERGSPELTYCSLVHEGGGSLHSWFGPRPVGSSVGELSTETNGIVRGLR